MKLEAYMMVQDGKQETYLEWCTESIKKVHVQYIIQQNKDQFETRLMIATSPTSTLKNADLTYVQLVYVQ